MNKIVLLAFLTLMLSTARAQEIKNVDVNKLSQSEINKAKKAINDAGLSPAEAAEMARMKGATEQQIQDFENRISQDGAEGEQTINDPLEQAEQVAEEQENTEKSTRKADYNASSRVFGAYLFNSKNLTFEPSLKIQTPKNYELGIGDQIIINIWGNSQNNYQLTVNKNGQVLIPDVGPIYIAGLTFSQSEEKIKQRLTQIYADMAGDNPGTFAQVNMSQLRSIQVNLVGEVTTPGTYTLPVTASVFNALYLSGGPSGIGSFRNIKIIRDNKTVESIDIYDFLIDANTSGNVSLKDNDIIFIPPAQKKVTIEGLFRRNGIFELKENEMLNDLIRFAGGFTEDAYLKNIQLQRKTQQGLQVIDIDFSEIATTPLVNGDKVSNTAILKSYENRVTITGAVYRPGEYQWTPGLTLFDLIIKADSLTADVYKNRGIITRFNDDLTTSTIAFNVDDVVSGKTNIPLQQEDLITIKSHFEIGEQPSVRISGEVMHPGQLSWSEKLSVADVLFMAGGFTEAADSSYIEVARRLNHREASTLNDTLVHIFNISHSRNLETSQSRSFQLKPYDRISVKRAPGYREQGSVTIAGEVVYAGVYALRNKHQRISDLIKLAKGTTPQAFINGATLRRQTEELGSETIAINLKEILNNPESEKNLFLRNGDMLYIPEFSQTVKINGAVQNPFSITYSPGKSLKYYIDKTGGFDTEALKRKVYVQYANGYTASTKSFIVNNYPQIQPGCQIIVPKKPERERGKGLATWLAVSSAFSSLALAVAAVLR